MVIDRKNPNDDETIPMVHFRGYWEKPSHDDIVGLYNELRTDEEFGLIEIIDNLDLVPATQEVIEHYNSLNYDHEKNY